MAKMRLGVILAGMLGLAAAQAAPWHSYVDTTLGYSIQFPPGWTIDTKHVSAALGPDHEIHGVAFRIPAALAAGTNLSTDTELAVESLPGANCAPGQFVDPADDVHKLKADGRVYSTATSDDAGAGNRYETQIFVLDGTSPCLAVRYFIHSTALGNYDPGTVKAFDRAKLVAAFDRIRATLKLGK